MRGQSAWQIKDKKRTYRMADSSIESPNYRLPLKRSMEDRAEIKSDQPTEVIKTHGKSRMTDWHR